MDAKICTCLLPYYKTIRFPPLQKAMDKTLSIAFYARITTGKRAIKTGGSLHCCLQSITQFPDEITKAHKIRHTLYNVSIGMNCTEISFFEVDLIYKAHTCPPPSLQYGNYITANCICQYFGSSNEKGNKIKFLYATPVLHFVSTYSTDVDK